MCPWVCMCAPGALTNAQACAEAHVRVRTWPRCAPPGDDARCLLVPGPFLAFAQEAMLTKALVPACSSDDCELPGGMSATGSLWAFRALADALLRACCCPRAGALWCRSPRPSSAGWTGVWPLPAPTPQWAFASHPCIALILGCVGLRMKGAAPGGSF